MKKTFILLAMAFLLVLFASERFSYAQAIKPIELKFSHFLPPTMTGYHKAYLVFAKEVEERTKGRVKVSIFPSGALGGAKDHFDMAKRGVVDISHIAMGYTPGRFPLSTVMELPLGVSSARVGSLAFFALLQDVKSEYIGVKLLNLHATPPGQLFTVKKLAKTPEDIKGFRLRSPGATVSSVIKVMGASPITMPVTELYEALQRGLLDGCMNPWNSISEYRIHEVTKHITTLNLFLVLDAIVMNQKAWDGLPPDIQKIIEELAGPYLVELGAKIKDDDVATCKEMATKIGVQIYETTSEERKLWENRFKAIQNKWVDDMEAKGLPGKKVYEKAVKLVQQYSR